MRLGLVLAALIVSIVLGEVVLRLAGRVPFIPEAANLRVEPGGRYQGPDATLGYRHLPGRYRITFDNGDTWTATHGPDTLRITRPPDAPPPSGPGIWIFGCSFVHGWGLDDADTFPWKVQELLSDHDVRNFGVGGYGTLQSLLQFQGALANGSAPEVAVLAYAGFHDERNTRLRRWRRATFAYERFGTTAQPFARLTRDATLTYAFDTAGYRDLRLLRHSALLSAFESAFDLAEDRWRNSHAVSQVLVSRFQEEASANGVRFVLATITRGTRASSMRGFAEQHGIETLDISVDGRDPANRIAWDAHPSAVATSAYARAIADLVLGGLQAGAAIDAGAANQ
jgi:hypothetical protein